MIRRCGSLLLALVVLAVVQTVGATAATVGGPVTSPLTRTGRWLTDTEGRVVIVHGFNIMWKVAPYYPFRFTAQDAAFLADNGFTAARLGLIWAGIEPSPGHYDDAVLGKQAQLNDLLGRYGIRTLVDFHQDGPGAFPGWATLGSQSASDQYQHFWDDDKASDGVGIQTHFVNMWRHVSSVLGPSSNILGFDPLNEPQAPQSLQCPYAFGPCPSFESGTLAAFMRRVIASVRAGGARQVIWPEGVGDSGFEVPALPKFADPQTGFNAHIYCPTFSTNSGGAACLPWEQRAFHNYFDNYGDKLDVPVIVSEFSSTDDETDNTQMVDLLESHFASWMSWAYTNSTGGGEEGGQGFVANDNQPGSDANVNAAKADAMVVPYAQAIAGTPQSQSFDHSSHVYTLSYTATPVPGAQLTAGAPTQVFIPRRQYAHGYVAQATGATIVSAPTSPWIELVADAPGATVSLRVTPAAASTTETPLQTGAVPVDSTGGGSHLPGCPAATGRLHANRIGRLVLGMTRARARRTDPYVSRRGRRADFFCLRPAGILAGYRRGRIVLLATGDRRYAYRGARPGARMSRRLRAALRIRVGGRLWYLTARERTRGLVGVLRGRVIQVGIVDGRVVPTRKTARGLLRSLHL